MLTYAAASNHTFTGADLETITAALLNLACLQTLTASGTLEASQVTANTLTPAKMDFNQGWFKATDAGTANSHALTLANGQTLTSYTDGLIVAYKVATTNTAAVVAGIDAVGTKAIKKNFDQALDAYDLRAGQVVVLRYVSATDVWQLLTPVSNTVRDYVVDSSGAANTLLCAPGIAWGAYAAGKSILVKVANTNTGATNANVSSLGNRAVKKNGTTALAAGDLVAGQIYELVDDGTNFQILNVVNKRFTFTTAAALSGAAATLINEAHGLSAAPGAVHFYLVCITSDTINGRTYAVGDRLPIESFQEGTGAKDQAPAFQAVANATNVVLYQKEATVKLIEAGTATEITYANWKAMVVADL